MEKEGATKAAAPPRLALPPRQSGESIFRGGSANTSSGISPGPMTLVSSFFADDPESDCRSFLQLLAGAMGSPAGVAGLPVVKSAEISDVEEIEEKMTANREARIPPQIFSPNCFVPCQVSHSFRKIEVF